MYSLGILLDSRLLLVEQVAVMARRAIAQLCVLCPFLDWEFLRSVTQALVILWLDYCNVLYMRIPLKTIWNTAGWAVLGAPRMVHITLLFRKLQWLPVCFGVQFKVLIITFKALPGMKSAL